MKQPNGRNYGKFEGSEDENGDESDHKEEN
jgi:hypothetical protein